MNSVERQTLLLIGEDPDAPDVFSDITPIRDSCNAAIQELCLATGAFVRTYHVPLLAGRQVYRILPGQDHWGWPTEVMDLSRRRKLQHVGWKNLSNEHPNWMIDSGDPLLYATIGLKHLAIWPVPSASGLVLEIRAVMVPRRYEADNDPIRCKKAWLRAVTHYAVSEYYASRGDAQRAAEAHKTYLDLVGLASLQPSVAEKQWQMGQTGWDRSQTH